MPSYAFHKMQALGNDFIVFDARQQAFELSHQRIAHWSDRHTGIGCDQWLIIEAARSDQSHASYRIFNADGSQAEQCLNGLRCIAWFLSRTDHVTEMQLDSPTHTVKAIVHPPMTKENATQARVEVQLPAPSLGAEAVHWHHDVTAAEAYSKAFLVSLDSAQLEATGVNMGNPHAVFFVTDARQSRARYGVKVSTHQHFTQGVNAGFAEIRKAQSNGNNGSLFLCVFERGAGPTHACGSGACAAAVAAIQHNKLPTPVKVRQPGGLLVVDWQGEGHPVHLHGPAEYVFSGEFFDESNG